MSLLVNLRSHQCAVSLRVDDVEIKMADRSPLPPTLQAKVSQIQVLPMSFGARLCAVVIDRWSYTFT